MTTTELIKWAAKAADVKEASWQPKRLAYKLSIPQAVDKAAPKDATQMEHQVVHVLLFNCWNEVQHWSHELSEQ